ncbi:MAG: M20/M25/M40 family metallo-hydrolase [Candidatus Omnitrophica bacterium]|nr:M20/M25/M40 family metallo-hydrolase [Candidatus Omnitrophota bacterium]
MAAGPLDLLALAKRLVGINTSTWKGNAEAAVLVGDLSRKIGLAVYYQEERAGEELFMNVAGLTPGKGKHPLLLATHLDTVEPGDPGLWTKTGKNPWRLTAAGDSLYGLGAADTKLDILCKLSALSRLPLASLKRPVMILGTYGEESGLRGAARFCQGDFPKPEMALVGEPTDLALVHRHKGLAVAEFLLKEKGLHRPAAAEWQYEVRFKGRAAHSSTPGQGENALQASLLFLEKLKTRFPKVAVLAWEGGTALNIIPEAASLRFSLGGRPRVSFPSARGWKVQVKRLKPGWYQTLAWERALELIRSLEDLLLPLARSKDKSFDPPSLTSSLTWLKESKEGWQIALDVRSLPGQSLHPAAKKLEARLWKRFGPPGAAWHFRLERDNPPLDLEKGSALVKLAAKSLRKARLPVTLAAKAGCSEAGLYSKVGIPSLVFGPGRSAGNIHRPNEMVSLKQLKKAIRFYEAFIRQTCC